MTPDLQYLMSAITVAGAGVSAYVGVRVALAELRGDIKALKAKAEECDERLNRLESPYFQKDHRPSPRRP